MPTKTIRGRLNNCHTQVNRPTWIAEDAFNNSCAAHRGLARWTLLSTDNRKATPSGACSSCW